MRTSSEKRVLAVEWACVGPEQIVQQWQQITWNEEGRILSITPIRANQSALRTLAKGKVALPGFVNAHAHLTLSCHAPIPMAPTETMGDWLLAVVAASRQQAQQPDGSDAILKGIQEAVGSGTTTIASTVTDFYTVFRVLEALPPVRTLWWLEWFHPSSQVSASKLNAITEALHAALFYIKTVSKALSHRTQLGVSPHSPYNVSLPAWQALQHQLIMDNVSVVWQTHLLESMEEVAYYQKNATVSSRNSIDVVHQTLLGAVFQPSLPCPDNIVASMANFDLLQPTLSVVHGLELSNQQAEQLGNAGVSLVTCPRSNQFLHQKLLSESLLQCPALTIAIGTDAPVSLPKPAVLDMRLELQVLKFAYPWLRWEDLLKMATLNGTKALGMAGQVGELTVGAWADMAIWQVSENVEPLHPEALLATILNTSNPPCQVIVGGLSSK